MFLAHENEELVDKDEREREAWDNEPQGTDSVSCVHFNASQRNTFCFFSFD